MNNGKTYAAEEIRHTAENLEWNRTHGMEAIKIASEHVIDQLRYAADMVERCEDYIKTMQECGDNMYSKIIEDILTKILRGDAGNEGK